MATSAESTFTIGENHLINIAEAIIAGEDLPESVALELLSLPSERAYDLMYAGNLVKRYFMGADALHRCSIVNAKSGGCSEDCGFCAQSARYDTDADRYTLMSVENILRAADVALQSGSTNFGIVTAMRAIPKGKALDHICDAIRELRKQGKILPDASLGILGKPELEQLRDAGLEVYHHNLETCKSFYPQVTSTRTWQDNWNTLVWAREVGLKVCCGGILGMGESTQQRVEFFAELRELGPDKVPLNFLVAVPGTPLEDQGLLEPMECLKIVAVMRLMLPKCDIFVAGGRVQHLRQLQSMIFFAGATGMMVGNYLTTPGRTKKDDLELLRDLELIAQSEFDELMQPAPIPPLSKQALEV